MADWAGGHAPETEINLEKWLIFVTTRLVPDDELLIFRTSLETNPSCLNDKIPCRRYVTLRRGTAASVGVPVTSLEADRALPLTILPHLLA
jgi:hypothetical protein